MKFYIYWGEKKNQAVCVTQFIFSKKAFDYFVPIKSLEREIKLLTLRHLFLNGRVNLPS